MIKIYPESNNTSLYVWGYKIGYTSCWLSCRDNHPWDLTSCNFTLDKIGNYDYDDMTPAFELFDFTEDMSKEQRIKNGESYMMILFIGNCPADMMIFVKNIVQKRLCVNICIMKSRKIIAKKFI